MPLSRTSSRHGTLMAVSMMKDEAPFLLEWVAHHLAVGFTDILVYTNDCTDGTVEMLERLEQMGLGYHRPNVIKPGGKPQPSAISHAEREPLVAASDWVMLLDADEFLCINHRSGTLDGMLDDAVDRGANGIVVTWRIFGSGGTVDWSPEPVTEQFLHAAPPLWRLGWGVKTLFRYDPDYWRLGIHRPKIRNKHLETGFPDTVVWLNGSGQPMEDYFKFRGWRSIRRTLGYEWAQVNHYAVKSVDGYALRKLRGNVNNKTDKYDADYWSLQDRNEIKDDRILRHAPRRREIMDKLLGDPVLRRLHETAQDAVEARLRGYRKTPEYRALKARLLEASRVPLTRVTAKPPKARDPEKIAALMSEVEKKLNLRPEAERRSKPSAEFGDLSDSPFLPGPVDISTPGEVETFPNHGISIAADPRVFTPEALEVVIAGKLSRRAARSIARLTEGAGVLVDIGDGFGFCAMVAAKADPNLRAVICPERADLVPFSRRTVAANGLDGRVTVVSTEAEALDAGASDATPRMLRIPVNEGLPTLAATEELGGFDRILLHGIASEEHAGMCQEELPQGAGWTRDRSVSADTLVLRRA